MNTEPNSVGLKLHNLDQQYEQLKQDVRICESGNSSAIRNKINVHRIEVHKEYLLLQDRAENSRSPVLAQMSKAQIELLETFEDILSEHKIEEEEAASLHAEHAIDLVIQTMRRTQLIMLYAADYALTNEK